MCTNEYIEIKENKISTFKLTFQLSKSLVYTAFNIKNRFTIIVFFFIQSHLINVIIKLLITRRWEGIFFTFLQYY